MLNECTGLDKSKENNNKEKQKQWLRGGGIYNVDWKAICDISVA